MNDAAVPYDRIDAVFLDVGNTLISIDFDWVAAEVGTRGFACEAAALRRAEAAARPGYSRRLFVDGVEAGTDVFHAYLTAMFERLDVMTHLPPSDLRDFVSELRPVLRPNGRASALWRAVMPQVPEALAQMRGRGLTLVVVSNSDGTVEHSLEAPVCASTSAPSSTRRSSAARSRTGGSSSRRCGGAAHAPSARCTLVTSTTRTSPAPAPPGSMRCCSIRTTIGPESTATGRPTYGLSPRS